MKEIDQHLAKLLTEAIILKTEKFPNDQELGASVRSLIKLYLNTK